MIRVTVPAPPSTNALYSGRRFKTVRYKSWIDEAGWAVKRALGDWWPIEGRLRVEIILSGMRTDIDNIKALLDLCQSMGLIVNDRFVDDLHIVRVDGEPSATISIWARSSTR